MKKVLAFGFLLMGFSLVLSLGTLFSPLANALQRWALGQQWAGHDLVCSENSVYGNVAVFQRQGQYTFYTGD